MDAKTLKVQKQVFDISEFQDVTLVKEVSFTPVASVTDALAMLGNDNAKLLEVINAGLESEVRESARLESDNWLTDEGSPFEGTAADKDDVDSNVLVMAKTLFGYNKDLNKDEKRAAKQKAMDLIRNTPAIRDGLVANALAKSKEPTK